jgi:hypothetical protein
VFKRLYRYFARISIAHPFTGFFLFCLKYNNFSGANSWYGVFICHGTLRRSVGLLWSNDPESYAGSSVATGSAFHAIQVKGDRKGYTGPPGCGVERGADKCSVEKLLKLETGRQFWKRLRSTKDCSTRRRIIIRRNVMETRGIKKMKSSLRGFFSGQLIRLHLRRTFSYLPI